MNNPNKPPSRPFKTRTLLRIAGPVITVVGIALISLSAMSFASTVGSERALTVDMQAGRSLRTPKYGWFRWAGMTLIFAGVVVTSVGFELFTGRKSKSKPESSEPARRKIVGEPLGQLGKKPPANRPPDGRKKRD